MIRASWIHADGTKIEAVYTDSSWRVRLAMIARHGGRVLKAEPITLEGARRLAFEKLKGVHA